MTPPLRRLHRSEAGISLTELLVTIVLMGLISTALIASVVAVQRNLGVANATMVDMTAGRIAIERVAALLRGAVAPDGRLDGSSAAVTVAAPDRVRLYSVTGRAPDANPVQVEVAVEGGDLVERTWDPIPDLREDLGPGVLPAYAAAPSRERVVARDLIASTVFTYWTHVEDASGPASRCGRVLAAPTPADLVLVDSVSIRVQLQEPTGYDSAASDLQGWARFASGADLGFSASSTSAGCLDAGGFAYTDAYGVP